jgi:HK97 family phage major capsid protein
LDKNLESREKQLHDLGLKLTRRLDNCKSEKELSAIAVEIKAYEEAREQYEWDKQRSDYANHTNHMGRGYASARGHESETTTKNANRVASVYDIPVVEFKNMFAALQRKQDYRIETSHMFGAQTKAPVTEGGFTSGSLPPILLPFDLELPYDPTDVFAAFTQMAAPQARAIEYLQHTSNTNPPSFVAEMGTKVDLGPQLTTVSQTFNKVAAMVTVSNELIWDYKETMPWMTAELNRAIIDARNNACVNGNGTGSNLTGLLNVSGTLTRSVGSDTPLDAVRKAANDIRVGSTFATPNVIFLHPLTHADLQLQKSTTGQYLLGDPQDPATVGGLHSIFDLKVVTSAYVPAGTAILADDRWLWGWTRMGLLIETATTGTDASGTNLWTQNAVGIRAEMRIATGYPRPASLNILTGLPAS